MYVCWDSDSNIRSIAVETCAAHVGVMVMFFVAIDKVSVCLSVCLSACVCVQVLWN